MNTTVSVIVPHHNRPELVGRALKSIANQTARPLEVILVDDGSTPENWSKLQQYGSLATIVATPENLGISGARNFGAQRARGEWITFLDDDDCYLPNKIELQLTYLEQHPEVQALSGGFTMRRPDGSTEHWGGSTTKELALRDALQKTVAMSQALMIRRSVFLQSGGFDRSLTHMEDYELSIRLLRDGVTMHTLGEALFLYHFGGEREQLTRNWKGMVESELRVIRQYAHEARTTFGRFGERRLIAACYTKWGLRIGGLAGRRMWLVGLIMERLFGHLA